MEMFICSLKGLIFPSDIHYIYTENNGGVAANLKSIKILAQICVKVFDENLLYWDMHGLYQLTLKQNEWHSILPHHIIWNNSTTLRYLNLKRKSTQIMSRFPGILNGLRTCTTLHFSCFIFIHLCVFLFRLIPYNNSVWYFSAPNCLFVQLKRASLFSHVDIALQRDEGSMRRFVDDIFCSLLLAINILWAQRQQIRQQNCDDFNNNTIFNMHQAHLLSAETWKCNWM